MQTGWIGYINKNGELVVKRFKEKNFEPSKNSPDVSLYLGFLSDEGCESITEARYDFEQICKEKGYEI